MSLHLELKEHIEQRYAGVLLAPVELRQDALILVFDNGVHMEVRFASTSEYAIGWVWGQAELRIDTAPLHPDLATFPHHLHDDAAKLHADPYTQPGQPAWENLQRVIDGVLTEPLCQAVLSQQAGGNQHN